MRAALLCEYRHPGRKVAHIRAVASGPPQLVETHTGQELSLGPVQFATDFGTSYSGAKPHGGWNCDSKTVWFAFNSRGSSRTAWKIAFEKQLDGSYVADHPYQPRVRVSMALVSLEQWLVRPRWSWPLGSWMITSSANPGATGVDGYLPVEPGAEVRILYEGTEGDEEGWVYAMSVDDAHGWVRKTCFGNVEWQVVDHPSIEDVIILPANEPPKASTAELAQLPPP